MQAINRDLVHCKTADVEDPIPSILTLLLHEIVRPIGMVSLTMKIIEVTPHSIANVKHIGDVI